MMAQELKEARYIEAKLAGKTDKEAGLAAGAKTEAAAKKYANRMSSNVAVQTILQSAATSALQTALLKHDLTLDRTAQVINEALKADKTVIIGKGDDAFADVVPDHGIRLKAADMLHGLMGIKQGAPKQPPQPPPGVEDPTVAKEIRAALAAGDTVRLQQIILERKDG